MTRKANTDKSKAIATTSKGTTRASQKHKSLWPRPEGKPFNIPTELDPRNLTRKTSRRIPESENANQLKEWCDYHSVFYNGMLKVAMEPTRLLDTEILREMGIEETVARLIHNMGLGVMPYKDFDLYPNLARQFLATCEIHDPAPDAPQHRRLYFFCHGKRHNIHIGDIGHIFKWDTIRYADTFPPSTLDAMQQFWEVIAYGTFEHREMKIARIGNPSLKMAAKALVHTFFCKEEADRISKSALVLLFTGLSQEMRSRLCHGTQPVLHRIDLSMMFANTLVERKYRVLGHSSNARIESIGSLITPLLKSAYVDLTNATVDRHRAYMDRTYLVNARIFRRGIYEWIEEGGIPKYCTLPRHEWTGVDNFDQILFSVPGDEQCTSYGGALPDFGTNPDPLNVLLPSPVDNTDEAAYFCTHGHPLRDPEPIISDLSADSSNESTPLPAGAPIEDWRSRRDRTQSEQTGLLRRMMIALTRIRWTPPPTCYSARDDTAQPAASHSHQSSSSSSATTAAPDHYSDGSNSDERLHHQRRQRRE